MAWTNPYQAMPSMYQPAWQQPAQMWTQPAPQVPQMQQVQQAPQPAPLVRVHGMEGARGFRMGPGETGFAFDDDRDVFYLLEADGSGTVRVTPFSFQKLDEGQQPHPGGVTREEFDALAGRVEKLETPRG